MIRIAIALLVGGGFLTFFGYNEHKLASSADSDPQSITAQELIANGYGDNAHVNVTDIYILNNYVSEYSEDNPNRFTKLWVPAISTGDPWVAKVSELAEQAEAANPNNPDYSAIEQLPYPTDIGMVIISKEVKSAAAFDTFWEKENVQGLVINDIDSLSGEELKILKNQYPGINPDKVIILEHKRMPKSTGITMLMLVGGVLLMLAGPGIFFLGRNK